MTSIALISDIHGNLPALEAVIADVRSLALDAVYVLGDMVNGCCWSAEVLDSIVDLGWPMLLGNHDDAVLQLDTPRMEPRYADKERYAALWWTRSHLSSRHLGLLASLPQQLCLTYSDAPPLCLLHGLPGNFSAGFRPDSSEDWAVRRLSQIVEGTIGSGHTHVAMVRAFGRWLVINSGSVGAPFDGDVRASYVWLEGSTDGWRADIRRVPYDIRAVDAGHRRSGLLAEGGIMGNMFLRSVLSGLPWVADFVWWLRDQPPEVVADVSEAQRLYDAAHGPGRWAFPYAD